MIIILCYRTAEVGTGRSFPESAGAHRRNCEGGHWRRGRTGAERVVVQGQRAAQSQVQRRRRRQ